MPTITVPSTTTTVGAKGRVTIPKAIREGLGLAAGHRVVFQVTATGVEIVPVELVPRDQAWFHSPAMQENVAAAEGDIRRGRVTVTDSEGAAQRHLDSLKSD